MSQQIGGYPSATAAGSPAGQPTTQVARDEATEVGRTAADAGRQVADTAAEQAATVAQEVKAQARDLAGEARGQVQDQARAGQQKAADGIRALSQELRQMADNGQQSGTVTEVARQVADRADSVAGWLGEREPGDLLEEVRSFARRRPGAFLLGAALAGVVVGRLTRGAVDAARANSGPTPQGAYGARYTAPDYPAPDYVGAGYTTPGHTTPGYTTPAAGGYSGGYAAPGYTEPAAAPYPAPSPVPSNTPTPPEGIPATSAYPTASTLPPAAPDPLAAPGRLGREPTVGEYVDDVERAGEHTYGDERPEAPYRGDGGLR